MHAPSLLAATAAALAAIPAVLTAVNLRCFLTAPRLPDADAAGRGGRERRGLPPVSVLVPARNEAAAIGRCAEAVLASRGVEVELVVLDDGSTDGTGDIVTRSLDYEAHAPLAEAQLHGLAEEAVKVFGLSACAVVHRIGTVPVGEASVAVAASAPHRREAFAAAEWLMERIKQVVPIWKREEAADGTRAWVHPDAMPAVECDP